MSRERQPEGCHHDFHQLSEPRTVPTTLALKTEAAFSGARAISINGRAEAQGFPALPALLALTEARFPRAEEVPGAGRAGWKANHPLEERP